MKRLDSCADCSEFPCPEYSKWAKTPAYHHVYWSLCRIREIGWDKWLSEYPQNFLDLLKSHVEEPGSLDPEGVVEGLRHISLKRSEDVTMFLRELVGSDSEVVRKNAKTIIKQLVTPHGNRNP